MRIFTCPHRPQMSSGEAVTAFYAMEEGRWSDVKNIVVSLVKEELEKPIGERGNNLLIQAAMLGKEDIVVLLLDREADIEAKNSDENTSLIISALNGHSEVVALLCQRRANKEAKNKVGSAALYEAAARGHVEVVKILLSSGANIETLGDGRTTPLIASALGGHYEIVDLLCKQRAELEAQDHRGLTALYWAAHKGFDKVVKILLEGGAKADIQDEGGWSALYWAAEGGYDKVVQILVDSGANTEIRDEQGRSALFVAAERGYEKVVQILVKSGEKNDVLDEIRSASLFEAAARGHVEVVEILLNSGANIETLGDGRNTPLTISAASGHDEVVALLCRSGSFLEAPDHRGLTALYVAAERGFEKMIKILLDGGAKTDMQCKEGCTALYRAALGGYDKVVQILIDARVNTDVRTQYGCTALHNAALQGFEIVVDILLVGNANMEIQNQYGCTALHNAALQGFGKVVKSLLGGGAKVDVQDRFGNTAIYVASERGHDEVVKMLLDGGANIEIPEVVEGRTAIYVAAEKGHDKVVQILLDSGANLEIRNNKEERTALHSAGERGYDKVVKILLDKGASIDTQDVDGCTALFTAAERGYDKVVKVLLDGGANPDIPDKHGCTPLHVAVSFLRIKVVTMLLDKDADITARDEDGSTALSLALALITPRKDHPSHEVVAAIRRAAQGWRRVRNFVLYLHSGGLASADWSVRRSDPHTVLAIPIPAIESTTVPTAASLPHEGLGNPLGRSKRKVVENRDLCRIISSYVPEYPYHRNREVMATISLGGVWEDLHSQLKAALDAQFNAETLLKDTILEKDALMIKIDAIEVEFKDALASLTMKETSHLESQQILAMIRSERDELRVQCASLISQREWLEQKVRTLNRSLADSEKNSLRLKTEFTDRCKQIQELELQSKVLVQTVLERDEAVQRLGNQLKEKLTTLEVVQHSLAAKDKMFVGVVKERDRLKDQLLLLSTAKHAARSPLRNRQMKSLNANRCDNLKESGSGGGDTATTLATPLKTLSDNYHCDGIPSTATIPSSSVSVGTQYDPLMESAASYYHRYQSFRCICGRAQADGEEDDDQTSTSNPWSKKLSVSSKSFNGYDLTYLAIIRRLQDELQAAQSSATNKSPNGDPARRRSTPIKSFR